MCECRATCSPPRTWQAPDCGRAHADERDGRTRDHLTGLPRVRLPGVVSTFFSDLEPYFKLVVKYQCWVRIGVSKILKVGNQVWRLEQGWAKLVLIALERYSVALKHLTFNLR
jgi:hypothetical protein